MAVATDGLLSSGKAAERIREETGRSCTRQNLEKLCRQGKLPQSCVSTSPVRLVAATVVGEYLERIDPRQAGRERPGVSQSVLDRAPDSVPRSSDHSDDELPPYTESQKRKAYEQANLLELERKQKEGLLLPAEQVQKVWANSVAIVKTKLLAVPSRLRQRIPHLTLEEIAIAEELIRESLEELSEGQADGE
jgi:phage terminase Nu1 subunit (DNA packaging protein)